jgi:hypothetical protein
MGIWIILWSFGIFSQVFGFVLPLKLWQPRRPPALAGEPILFFHFNPPASTSSPSQTFLQQTSTSLTLSVFFIYDYFILTGNW